MKMDVDFSTALNIVLIAVAIFLVTYPSLVFLANLHLVVLIYAIVPSLAIAILLGGWLTVQNVSPAHVWKFALIFVGTFLFISLTYRYLVEPVVFDQVFEIHFVLNRFSPLHRLLILTGVYVSSYVIFRVIEIEHALKI